MEKSYEPKTFESDIYQHWLDKEYFKASVNKNKTPFTIIMPPPNVTSKLHMGHAFQQSIQDIIIRRKRMQGYEALWLPGTDHAAIATETMLVNKLSKDGITKQMLGREKFLEKINEWYDTYKNTIINQFKRMGFSCDWSRLAFTMDKQNSDAVRWVFVHLYKKGWIYKGKRIVNWCVKCKSSISDAEVDYKDEKSNFWHIKYQIEGTNDFLELATTRPETMLGDTAVAVNPNDKRYTHLIGKNVILPLLNKPIPIVADDYVDIDFGTGVVKITPAHDPNDFEVGARHNLPVIRVLNDDGTMNSLAGEYEGLDRYVARDRIVQDLKKSGNLVKIVDYTHNVGHCDRCKSTIEPIISDQWFVKMSEIVKPAIEVVEKDEVNFLDKQYKKSYLHWLNNIKDWCISRQLWNGHKLPIQTCKDCGEVICELEDASKCPKCGSKNLVSEVDTLDTWFSSALWPLSTLGFPNITEDLKYFYPTNVMVTGREIINLWVARMIFSGLEYYGEKPFSDIVINGIVKDAHGKKMSKTLGNGVDPIDMIEKYGVDVLRYSLFNGVSIGIDSCFSEKKVELSRNFLNKLWNASNFVLRYKDDFEKVDVLSNTTQLSSADKWILEKLNSCVKKVNTLFEKYEIGIALSKITDFFWDDFCDWYIELAKTSIASDDINEKNSTISVLFYVLENVLKLLHPYVPFITEKIYQELPNHEETIVLAKYPEDNAKLNHKDGKQFEKIISLIKAVRNCRAGLNVPDNKRTHLYLETLKDKQLISANLKHIEKQAFGRGIDIIANEESIAGTKCNKVITELANVYIPLDELVDRQKELDRLNAELKRLESEIARSEKMLANVGFVSKAPKELIEGEKAKIVSNKALKIQVEQTINNM